MASLKRIIAELPIGKKNAMKVPDFEIAIGNQPTGTNNDTTRNEVTKAIHDHDIPVGSNSNPSGYWLIDSDAEYEEVIKRLNSYIKTYTDKRDAIKSNSKCTEY